MKKTQHSLVQHQKAKLVSKLRNGFVLDDRYPELLLRKSFLLLVGKANTYKTTIALMMVVNAIRQSVFDPALKLRKVFTIISNELEAGTFLWAVLAGTIMGSKPNFSTNPTIQKKNIRIAHDFLDFHGFELDIRSSIPRWWVMSRDLGNPIDIHHVVLDQPIAFGRIDNFLEYPAVQERISEILCRNNKGARIMITSIRQPMKSNNDAGSETFPGINHFQEVNVTNRTRYRSAMELHTQVVDEDVWVVGERNMYGPANGRYRMIENY